MRVKIKEGDGDHRHGTLNGYGNLACRCSACKEAGSRGNSRSVIGRTEKKCSGCQVLQPVSNFHQTSARPDGYIAYCKPCSRKNTIVYNAKRRERDPEFQTDYVRWTRYRIRRSEYDEMVKNQKGVCAICKCPPSRRNAAGKIRGLDIDHDHRTGRIRSLLCADCNNMLGYVKDNYHILRAAADYLQEWDFD